jgi:hypothetical protein
MTSRRRATSSRKPRATASAVTALRCRSGGRPASARCFTITANATDEHWHRWPRPYIRDFHLLAHHLHDRAMCLAGLRLDHTMRPLSHREQQCLQCLMRGETPGQIAAAWSCRAARFMGICERHGANWNARRSSRPLPRPVASTSSSKPILTSPSCNRPKPL